MPLLDNEARVKRLRKTLDKAKKWDLATMLDPVANYEAWAKNLAKELIFNGYAKLGIELRAREVGN